MIHTSQFSLTPLLKTQQRFEAFRKRLDEDQHKAGAIQAFEFCFELSWKAMKRFLEVYQTEKLTGPRDTFRAAAAASLINDPEVWFDFLDYRNLTSHTYEEDVADEVITIFPLFSDEMEKLVQRIQAKAIR